MNAIVAIGGAALFRVVDAYRALVPSAVWVLGIKTPRDPNDPLLRSLESLLEPFMAAYFEGEVRERFAEISANLTAHPLPAGDLDPKRVVDAVAATLGQGLSPAMALVVMLDRAHAIQPVELVLTDDTSGLANTAVAWARARGLPVVILPSSAPLRRPRTPNTDRTIVVGKRARRTYNAIDLDESLLAALPPPDPSLRPIPPDEHAARRTNAKAALTKALGWPTTDVVVLFEPAEPSRDSALECAGAFDASLAAMFDGFVIARARVPSLRLAVVTQPVPSDGFTRAAQAAANAGVAAGDFAYSVTNHEVWMAGADIVVSIDSLRSIEAAVFGIPAVNLWRPANWYLGPAFAAEDGVIDVSPQTLGATLVALAVGTDLRAQIAAIARDRVAGDAPGSPGAVSAIALELVKRRRPATTIARKPKPDIIIWAPDLTISAGIRALHRLCHLINMAGGDAWMFPPTKLHPTWNTPRRDTEITDRTIVVYPEIVFQPLPCKRIVRWVLNVPGLLGGPTTYGPEEMVFYFHQGFRAAAQAATVENLSDERYLPVHTVDPELFYNDRSRPRLYDCVYVGKGDAIYQRLRHREIRDAFVIQRGVTLWPASRNETAAMLRGCRRLYSFDGHSAIAEEAVICGAQVFYVRDNGELEEQLGDMSGYVQWYYDLSHVERFLRLISERWE